MILRVLTQSSPELRQQKIRATDPLWVNGCMNTAGEKTDSVLCFSIFFKFIIPNRINQKCFWCLRELSGGAIISDTRKAEDSSREWKK